MQFSYQMRYNISDYYSDMLDFKHSHTHGYLSGPIHGCHASIKSCKFNI